VRGAFGWGFRPPPPCRDARAAGG